MHSGSKQQSAVVDTTGKRMQRTEDWAAGRAETARLRGESPNACGPLSSINHARFGAMAARLAQVAAKASADALRQPERAHDAVPEADVLRFLSDVRRIMNAVAEFAAGEASMR